MLNPAARIFQIISLCTSPAFQHDFLNTCAGLTGKVVQTVLEC